MHGGRERLDVGHRLADFAGDFRRRRQVRCPEPVVPHHALLVRVGDGPALQRVHRLEGAPQDIEPVSRQAGRRNVKPRELVAHVQEIGHLTPGFVRRDLFRNSA